MTTSLLTTCLAKQTKESTIHQYGRIATAVLFTKELMVTLQLVFPVIIGQVMNVKVTDSQAEDLFDGNRESQATFIFEQVVAMNPNMITGIQMIADALETGHARIYEIK